MNGAKITSILKGDFILKGTALMSIGFFVASIFNYLLQVVLGRVLTIPEFGVFNALLSLSYLFIVPANVLSLSLVKVTSELKAKNSFNELTHLYKSLVKWAILLGSILALFIYLSSPWISSYLRIENRNIFATYSLFLGATFLTIIPAAFLQGLLRFKGFAFFAISSSVIRLILPLLFIYLGYRVAGVFGGLFIFALFSYVLAHLILKKNLIVKEKIEVRNLLRRILTLSIPVLIIRVSLDLMGNVDLILVKHFFTAHDAGLYAGVVTICKVFLFGAGMLGMVMYPIISEIHAKGESIIPAVKKFIIIQLVLVTGGLITFVFFPDLISGVMFGQKYIESAAYVPLFALFVGVYILINFFTMLCIAVGKVNVYAILSIGVILQFIGIQMYHTNLYNIISVNLVVSICVLVVLLAYTAKILNHEKSIHNNSRL